MCVPMSVDFTSFLAGSSWSFRLAGNLFLFIALYKWAGWQRERRVLIYGAVHYLPCELPTNFQKSFVSTSGNRIMFRTPTWFVQKCIVPPVKNLPTLKNRVVSETRLVRGMKLKLCMQSGERLLYHHTYHFHISLSASCVCAGKGKCYSYSDTVIPKRKRKQQTVLGVFSQTFSWCHRYFGDNHTSMIITIKNNNKKKRVSPKVQ